MKKLLAIVAICAIVAIHACSKKSSNSNILMTDPNMAQPVVLNATVSAGKTFTFTLGNSGTANIIKQAAHFQVSEASADENGALIYKYTPAANFSGTDEVDIVYTATAGGGGSGCTGSTSGNPSAPSSSTYYAIKFNVGD